MLTINKYLFLFLFAFIAIASIFYLKCYESFSSASKKYLYTAVMIEPREHAAFEFVMTNFLQNLNDDWGFVIFHGTKNKEYVTNIINTQLSKYKDRITLKQLNVDNLTVPNYSKLVASKDFYKDIPTETFLIFQTDSLICEEHKDLINNFIKYDYVGAPWINGGVGNGGLSIRKKTKMLEIINKCPYDGTPEDIYFSECPSVYLYKPSFEKSKTFSVENVYNEVSFGIHKPWLLLNKEQLSVKNKRCKGLYKLKQLNS